MQRATTEWFLENDNDDDSYNWITNKDKIVDFFRKGADRARNHESYYTLGMRGAYDVELDTEDPATVVQDVLGNQRAIFKDVYGREDGPPRE